MLILKNYLSNSEPRDTSNIIKIVMLNYDSITAFLQTLYVVDFDGGLLKD